MIIEQRKVNIGTNEIECYGCARFNLEGNKLTMVNRFTGKTHVFPDGKEEQILTKKDINKIRNGKV